MLDPLIPPTEDWIPPSGAMFGEPPVSVEGILRPTDLYRVLSIHQTTRYPPDGREIPTIDTTFAVAGDDNIHELYIDNYAFTWADPERDLRGRAKRIRRLYALPKPPPPDPEEL